ncbi:MAG: heterodisulfide reductase, partial [Deltaproteobacteria bacterium]
MVEKIGAVMVIGGGVGGIQAALDLAESGYFVYLVDSSPTIGGVMAQLDKTFPTNDCSMCILSPKLVECGRHLNIEIISNAEIRKVEGEAGNFRVELVKKARYVDPSKCTGCGECAKHCPVRAIDTFNEGLSRRAAIYIKYPQAVPRAFVIDREKCIGCGLCERVCLAGAIKYTDEDQAEGVNVGAIILCPGYELFDARQVFNYGYSRYPNVVTSIEFERILSASGPYKGYLLRPSDRDIPEKIAFIQCVGSRDITYNRGYCSSVCCTYAIKEAIIAKEHSPVGLDVTIFYMDMRTYGKGFDRYYQRAKDEYGIKFVRSKVYEVKGVDTTGDLILRYTGEDGRVFEDRFDLVVLSVGF